MSSPNPKNRGKARRISFYGVVAVGERLIALTLALLLLRSAFAHLCNIYYFLSTVYSYQFTGIEMGKWVAIVLPYLQVVVAVCLLARWWLLEAYLLSTGLFLVFFSFQLLLLRKGLSISCGCFGAAESLQVGRVTLSVAGIAALISAVGCMITIIPRHMRIYRGYQAAESPREEEENRLQKPPWRPSLPQHH